ncbi:cupin domain-containing protein [Methylobacterium radiotolerans]|nr:MULTISPECIES: cupin domain-containing protein [Methylobacterium]KIU37095.1 cupin [Methylobacterium radiotolerans]KTS10521.1 cupin [Methylobacterium radiotolerans]KTS50018.1 cupin [Methylobacterium radiotolerans]MDE3744310.1 cupin domain-containing protein [Methylobacterium radiotolerans]PJI54887.1 cupin domain-containing protein [Methylobacterium radiotolerans]
MRLRRSCCLVFLLAGLAPHARAGEMIMVTGDDAVRWRAAPPSLPKGSEISIIAGDPDRPGPFTLRLRFPPDYVIAPHTHATDESVTLLSGNLVHDMGETIDASRGQRLQQGAFLHLPARMPHALWTTREPAVIQVSGTGPFGLDYVNPSDDPRKTRPDR